MHLTSYVTIIVTPTRVWQAHPGQGQPDLRPAGGLPRRGWAALSYVIHAGGAVGPRV